jgi:membrane protease YdiL (CAAX protease family)
MLELTPTMLFVDKPVRRLWLEGIVVCLMVMGVIKLALMVQGLIGASMGPIMLIGVPLVLCTRHGHSWRELGLGWGRPSRDIRYLGLACAAGGGMLLIGLFVRSITQADILPVGSVSAENRFGWALSQCTHAAFPEEVFFRGYLVSLLSAIGKQRWQGKAQRAVVFAVLLSSLLFALSHVFVWGEPVRALTFFPGLLMGWLFVKTRSLVMPVAFHTLANWAYVFVV